MLWRWSKTTEGKIFVSLVCGSSRVIPKGTSIKGQLSIPRAELCAAELLAKRVQIVENDIKIENLLPTQYYTDSEDVLAWINNTKDGSKRYVSNRRQTICKLSKASQWQYIPTRNNPADIGTRPKSIKEVQNSEWTTGPAFLHQEPPVLPSGKDEQKHPQTILHHLKPLYDVSFCCY